MDKDLFVLYINGWGAAAKLLRPDADDFFKRSDLEKFQAHFAEVLRDVAISNPSVDIFLAGDVAHLTSNDASLLIKIASTVFKQVLVCDGRLRVWPLRGALALGANPVTIQNLENFKAAPWAGAGSVEAAWLEKSVQKGMRLFATHNLESHLTNDINVRTSRARGPEHFEINWMNLGKADQGFLDQTIEDSSFETCLRSYAKKLIEIESDYCRQLGSSFLDLIQWSKQN